MALIGVNIYILYTALFNDPATTVPRLQLDNDVDATFLAET